MTLFIHITHLPKPEYVDYLRSLLVAEVELTYGENPPDEAHYQILVDGYPTQALIEASSHLKTVIVPFVGAPNSTFKLLRGYPHIRLHNIHHNADSTAEFAFALLLAAAKHIVPADKIFRTHNWTPRHEPLPALILHGKTALILGYGAIGQRVARMCRALGMTVLAVKREINPTENYPDPVYTPADLPTLLPQTTALMVCLPLTDTTRGLIGKNELALLPSNAVVVNVGRGAIIEGEALYTALLERKIHAAASDVWYKYPRDESEYLNTPPSDFPFHELDNMVLSPHRAGGVETGEIETARMQGLAELMNAALKGEPIPNRVDLEKGY